MYNTLLRANQKRRDQLSIAANILEIARDGALKTQIMYRAGLSYPQLNDYLLFLIDNNLLTQSNINGKDVYRITLKGRNFLKRHHELTKMLKAKDWRKTALHQPAASLKSQGQLA
ncbi:MAG: winged helix-turn-helix domain-containing protein [Candidatus Bathyarchaeota archaeon]|nr:winged helix-turn-helix domain-containing protein [Candidatus Bathyarchaeota archaeon]